ncbi:MAG: caspase family protein [bacterium]
MQRLAAAALAALALPGCWVGSASVNYARYATYSNLPPGSYVEVGQIEEESWSHYLGFCDRAAGFAIADAYQQAVEMGGNALTDVEWETDDGYRSRPACIGGFAFYWWGAAAGLRARAIRIEPETLARLQQGGAAAQPAPPSEAVSQAEAMSPAPSGDPWAAPAAAETDAWAGRQPAAAPGDLTPRPAGTDGSNAYAVIIGISRYQLELPEATHGEDDARAFAAYAETTLGVPRAHIRTLVGDRASRAAINSMIEEWLPRNARRPGGRVYVFFSGHGAPDPETGLAYLVPWDADPAFLKTRGLGIDWLYDRLGELPDQEAVVFLDACFSGGGGRSVLAAGMRPLVPVQAPKAPRGRVVALTAAAAREATGAARDAPHGLFTRHLLGGLQGAADANRDGRVSLAELATHVTAKVSDDARLDNRDQTPGLVVPAGLDAEQLELVRDLR